MPSTVTESTTIPAWQDPKCTIPSIYLNSIDNSDGKVAVNVSKAENLKNPSNEKLSVAAKICIRTVKTDSQYLLEKYEYGRPQWTSYSFPDTTPIWEERSKLFEVDDSENSSLVVALFKQEGNNANEKFLGEAILSLKKLAQFNVPVRDKFVLKPTIFLPDVEVSGTVTLQAQWFPRKTDKKADPEPVAVQWKKEEIQSLQEDSKGMQDYINYLNCCTP